MLEIAFSEGMFCSNEYSPGFTPDILHVADFYFPVLDQNPGFPSYAVIQATGHQLVSLSRSVVVEEKGTLLGPLKTS